MKITKRTRTKAVLSNLDEKRLEELCKVVERDKDTSLYAMSVAEFAEVADGTFFENLFRKEKRLVKAIAKYKAVKEDMEQFGEYLSSLQPPKTKEEKVASEGIDFPSLPERMCIDLVKFFSLHSFDEAEKHTIAEWLVIHKDEATSALYQRRHSEIVANERSGK